MNRILDVTKLERKIINARKTGKLRIAVTGVNKKDSFVVLIPINVNNLKK